MNIKRSSIYSLVVVGLLLLGLLPGCSSPAKPTATAPASGQPAQGGTLTLATQADAATLDPHNTGDIPSGMVQWHVFETLFKWTDGGQIGPGLATDWSWSQDGLTLTMHLKKGVKFHDGTPFNAQAVKFNFDRVRDPANALRSGPMLAGVKDVQAPDDNTVVVTMSATSGALASNLAASEMAMVSKAALEKWGKDVSLHPVGTGPFQFVQWDTKEKIVVKAFADYHGPKPYLDQIIFKPVPNQQARVAMLEAGDAQVAAPIPLQDIERIKADKRFVVTGLAGMDNLHMPINNLRKPFTDVRVRQALNFAIDKEALVKSVYLGFAKPLDDSPVAPALFGYVPAGKFYSYDVAKAKQLLKDAGYADGFKMTIWIPDGRYVQDRRVSEAVAGFLKEIGVQVDLQTYEWATYVDKLLSSKADPIADYGAVLISFAVSTRDAAVGMAAIYDSAQWVPNGFNLSFYSNTKVDADFAAAQKATDPKERLKLYGEAGKQIMEDAPAIFLVTYQYVGAHGAKVHGVALDPNGGVNVTRAWMEK